MVGVADVSASAGVATKNIRDGRPVWSVVAVGIGVFGWYAAHAVNLAKRKKRTRTRNAAKPPPRCSAVKVEGLLVYDDEDEPLPRSWSPGFSRISEDEAEELTCVLASNAAHVGTPLRTAWNPFRWHSAIRFDHSRVLSAT